MTTQLPKRNPIILVIYAMLMISMFAFIVWTSLPYAEAVDAEQTKTTKTKAPEHTANTEPYSYSVLTRSIHIAGIRMNVDLSQNVEAQLNKLWAQFEQRNLAQEVKTDTPNTIYQVYSDYAANTNSVSVIIGYISNDPSAHNVSSVKIEQGRYLKLQDASVLDSWQNAARLPKSLAFRSDFETYQLTPQFELEKQTAFLSIHN